MNTLVERESEAMKFVINGRSYDTATAVTAAISRGASAAGSYYYDLPRDAESVRFERVLYRTPKGNFFVHVHETIKCAKGRPIVEDRAEAFEPHEAVGWIQMHSAMVLDPTDLPLPDEA